MVHPLLKLHKYPVYLRHYCRLICSWGTNFYKIQKVKISIAKISKQSWITLMIWGFTKKKKILELDNNCKFVIRTNEINDLLILYEIFVKQIYPSQSENVNPDWNVIDIGGHIGIFSILMGKKLKAGKVYVYEPFPENFSLLKENIELNGCSNIVVFNKAVCGENEKREIFKSEKNTGGHSLYWGGGCEYS